MLLKRRRIEVNRVANLGREVEWEIESTGRCCYGRGDRVIRQ